MTVCSLALLLALSPSLFGQAPSTTTTSDVQHKKLPTALVIEANGVETQGQLLRLDTREVVLLIEGKERQFDLDRVLKVQKKNSALKSYTLVGALAGAGSVLAPAVLFCQLLLGGCEGWDGWPTLFRYASGAGALGSAIGAVVGSRMSYRTVLFERPKPGKLPTSKTAGIAIRLRW